MEYLFNISSTVIAGLVTAILGIVVSILEKRLKGKQKEAQNEAENLADALAAEASASRARALQTLVDKLPAGLDPSQFLAEMETRFKTDGISQVINIHQDLRDTDGKSKSWSVIENLVNGYHTQAMDQARIQFWFSIAAATVGFAWIIYAATSISSEVFASYMKTLPGVAIDAVAFLFFRQAESTRQRATALYDRLRTDNQHMQAISLVESIDDMKVRAAVKAQISLHMAGLQPSPIDLSAFMKTVDVILTPSQKTGPF